MIEVEKNLYVGNQDDFEFNVKGNQGWAVIHACKEPYHRQALGYTKRAAPKNHPEYLLAFRENALILNLVDVDNSDWISPVIIDAAIKFIDNQLIKDKKVLVHCNQGMSRSAGIALLYLAHTGKYKGVDFYLSEEEFKKIYPVYNPALGMRGFMIKNWEKYNEMLESIE